MPPAVVAVVSGPPGVGKTALVVRWAHRVRDRFPDGQLYLDLRGYHPGHRVDPADALARLLPTLGVRVGEEPPGLEERAAVYRSHLDGRRMLLFLDNVAGVDQVRSLLPGGHSCFVIVTSRDALAGLVARDGAVRLDLSLLTEPDAVTLLRRLIGARVDAEPAAAAALATRCARLPLALRVAAELATSRPATTLAVFVRELSDQRRLDLVDAGGDPHAAVRAVFSWSCSHLPPPAARLFRLLGLFPGADLDVSAVAALAGVDPADAARLLELLGRMHLVESTGPGRHGMHDLLRAYAADVVGREETAAGRRAAQNRLFDHCLTAALARYRRLGDRGGEAYGLANLAIVHEREGRLGLAVEYLRQALSCFRETGDRGGEAYALTSLRAVQRRQRDAGLAVAPSAPAPLLPVPGVVAVGVDDVGAEQVAEAGPVEA